MNEHEKKFLALEPDFRRLEEEVKFILVDAIGRSGIKTHSVLSRVKTVASFLEKLVRKDIKNPFDTVDDLVGVRVVCLFRSDIKKLGDIVRTNFDVITEDNKLDGVSVEGFGYQSVHFVVRVHPSHSGPRYDGLHSLRAEIQVRTVAMDTWATLSHYLDYKAEPDVPRELRKDFYALSGLFYVADTHFELFYTARQQAGAAAMASAVATPVEHQELNLDTLRAYLAKRYPDREKVDGISELIGQLRAADISDLGQLHEVLERSAEAFERYEAEHPPGGGVARRRASKVKFADIGAVRISLSIVDPKFFSLMKYGPNDPILKYRSLSKKA